jgi:hypothetical protein
MVQGEQGAASEAGRAAPRPVAAVGMASRLSPPLRLPGAHFLAATVFLALGAAGLVWVAPDLAGGWFLSPRVVAVTHLFTLGWITLSIFGSLYQFLPVALGEPIRSSRLAYVTLLVAVGALGSFVWGLAVGTTWALVAGSTALSVAMLMFCGNLAATLARAGRRDLTWWSLAAAMVYLALTALLGLTLGLNLRWGFMGAGRWAALGVHFHLALGGWVLMVIIGVGHRLLPMFLLSHGADERWGRAAAWLVVVGVGWLVLFHHAPPVLAQWVPALLIGLGLAAFLGQAASFFRHSVKPRLDPGLRLAGAALGVLGAGLVLGAWNMAMGWASATATGAYGTAMILGVSLFVAAHYYKIVPFLIWYHRFGPLVGKQPVPQVAELYSGRYAALAALLMGVGFAGVAAAVLAGAAGWARLAAVVGACGVAVLAVQMTMISRRRP